MNAEYRNETSVVVAVISEEYVGVDGQSILI